MLLKTYYSLLFSPFLNILKLIAKAYSQAKTTNLGGGVFGTLSNIHDGILNILTLNVPIPEKILFSHFFAVPQKVLWRP